MHPEDFRIKVVTTRKCVTKTVKFEGIVVAIITIPLVYAGAIWLFELLNKPLLFPELIGV